MMNIRIFLRRTRMAAFLFLAALCFVQSTFATMVAISGVGSETSVLYEVDPATGEVIRNIGDTGLTNIKAIAFNPTNGLLFAHRNEPTLDSGSLYTLDITSARPTFIGDTHISASSITFDNRGTLFGWLEFHDGTHSIELDSLVTIDQFADAQMQVGVTARGLSPVNTNQSGLSFDNHGVLHLKSGDLDASGQGPSGPGQLYTLDPATGAATVGAALDPAPQNVLAFDPNNVAYTVSRIGTAPSNKRGTGSILQTIDIETGSLSAGQPIRFNGADIPGITSVAFRPVTAIPEPSSCVLCSLFAVLCCNRRRRDSPNR